MLKQVAPPAGGRLLGPALFSGAVVALLCGLYLVLPVGYDFYHWYRPVPLAWISGETRLYDEVSRGFYSPPWAVLLLLPFAVLPLKVGMTALTAVSLALTVFTAYSYGREAGARRPQFPALLAVLCPYSLNALLVGTLDPWALFGVYLAYRGASGGRARLLGAGLTLASVRPQDVLLTAPALLLAGARSSERSTHSIAWWVQVMSVPGATMLLSLALFGLDWPLRWAANYLTIPPGGWVGTEQRFLVTSTYSLAEATPLPLLPLVAGCLAIACYCLYRAWQRGPSSWLLDIATTANAIVSPHMHSQGYIVLLGLPWVRLVTRRPAVAALLYVMSLPVLLRGQGLWDRLGLLDVTVPLFLMVVLLLGPQPEPNGDANRQLETGRLKTGPTGP